MTNYEWIKNHIDDKRAFAHELCLLSECETCAAKEFCRYGHNGFMDYLDSECLITTREQWEAEHDRAKAQ